MPIPVLAGAAVAWIVENAALIGGTALLTLLGLGSSGCGKRPVDRTVEGIECANRDNGTTECTDGKNSIVFVDGIDRKIADFYLPKMEFYKQRILNFFGIGTPWGYQTLRIVPDGTENPYSGPGWAEITFPVSQELTIEKINSAIEQKIEIYPLAHEMSHSLRSGVASFPHVLEEGLAHFTEGKVLLLDATDVSPRYYYGVLREGDTADFTADSPIKYMKLTSAENGQPHFEFEVRKTFFRVCNVGKKCEWDAPPNVCAKLRNSDTIVCNEDQGDGGWLLRAYDYNQGDYYMAASCSDTEFVPMGRLNTVDGEIVFNEEGRWPYSQYENVPDDASPLRTLGLCFWNRIEGKYGIESINAILGSMVVFSAFNQSEEVPFPFLNTLMDVTGMGEAEARVLFETHHAPTDDEDYMIGGVQWP